MKTLQILLAFTVLGPALPAGAVTIHECEDDQGNRTFERHCPPGTTHVGQRNIGLSESTPADAGVPVSATVYVVPECDTCQQVREYLEVRGVAYSEIDVRDSVDMQNQLRELSGELRVPTTLVGGETVIGYNRGALAAALSAAGAEDVEDTGEEAAEGEAGETTETQTDIADTQP